MSDAAIVDAEKTRVTWHRIDISFKLGVDIAALTAAVQPTAELYAEGLPPAFEGHADDLNHRLLHWGWTCADAYGDYRRNPIPRIMGVYWDNTFLEDDLLLLPRIAPYIEHGSAAFFTADRWNDNYEGWFFDGTRAARRKAQKIVEYEFDD